MADGPRIYVKRRGETLVPADAWSADRISDFLKSGREYLIRTESARNPKQHKLVWVLATMIFENTEIYTSPEHVVEQFKRATGHVELREFIDNETGEIKAEIVPKSISYGAMKQEEFELWFGRVLDFITAHIWPGTTSAKLRHELDVTIGITIDPKRRAA